MTKEPSGSVQFSDLCENLITDGCTWLYPVIWRSNSMNWVAEIHSHPLNDSQGRSRRLAFGTGTSMEKACREAVLSYQQKLTTDSRKEQLLADPNVMEAFRLFNIPVPSIP